MFAKIGPFFTRELPGRLVEDLRAEHVGGKQVGRELNSLEGRVDRFGERANGQRLRESRHALEQHVSASQEADEQPLDHVFLPDDATPHLTHYALNERHVRLRGDLCCCATCTLHGNGPSASARSSREPADSSSGPKPACAR